MGSFQESMMEYQKQLEKGVINKAYKGLMIYVLSLRKYFNDKYPDYSVPGNIYFGYMDMTYFSIIPQTFKNRGLKIAVVFLHEECRFEVWLAGYNKQVQTKYWKLFKESGWKNYHIVPTTKDADSILEYILVENPDFRDLDVLTNQIDAKTLNFILEIEDFLYKHKN
jgi:hypothetical protein